MITRSNGLNQEDSTITDPDNINCRPVSDPFNRH